MATSFAVSSFAVKQPQFDSNTNWVTSKMHLYTPRSLTPEQHRELAEGFLRRDRNLRQSMRSCRSAWLVSILLGKHTAHLNIYDPRDVDRPEWSPMSQPAVLERASFFEVYRNVDPRAVDAERIHRIRHTHPQFYCVRDLTQAEIETLDNLTAILKSEPTHTRMVR